ncbi:hypothetical protein DFP72DRAFT_1128050 [Ephemerocybe angulata]|uniref:Uncharacterized protein n=1 Tax=Ephemerocybe angulata TaxID=980116 RepID=A0A8H6HXL1_9AGAR|nr:hypothetical protein DFP72DRAFT_1128050 [Tulosesus angulatus]
MSYCVRKVVHSASSRENRRPFTHGKSKQTAHDNDTGAVTELIPADLALKQSPLGVRHLGRRTTHPQKEFGDETGGTYYAWVLCIGTKLKGCESVCEARKIRIQKGTHRFSDGLHELRLGPREHASMPENRPKMARGVNLNFRGTRNGDNSVQRTEFRPETTEPRPASDEVACGGELGEVEHLPTRYRLPNTGVIIVRSRETGRKYHVPRMYHVANAGTRRDDVSSSGEQQRKEGDVLRWPLCQTAPTQRIDVRRATEKPKLRRRNVSTSGERDAMRAKAYGGAGRTRRESWYGDCSDPAEKCRTPSAAKLRAWGNQWRETQKVTEQVPEALQAELEMRESVSILPLCCPPTICLDAVCPPSRPRTTHPRQPSALSLSRVPPIHVPYFFYLYIMHPMHVYIPRPDHHSARIISVTPPTVCNAPILQERLQLANTRPTHANPSLPTRPPPSTDSSRQLYTAPVHDPYQADSPTLVTESHLVHCWPLSLAPRSCILRVLPDQDAEHSVATSTAATSRHSLVSPSRRPQVPAMY